MSEEQGCLEIPVVHSFLDSRFSIRPLDLSMGTSVECSNTSVKEGDGHRGEHLYPNLSVFGDPSPPLPTKPIAASDWLH